MQRSSVSSVLLPSSAWIISEEEKQQAEESIPEHETVPHLSTTAPVYSSPQLNASSVEACFDTLLCDPSISVTESNRHTLMHLKQQFSHVIRLVQRFSNRASQKIGSIRDWSSDQPLLVHLQMGGEDEECSDLCGQIAKLADSESILLDAVTERDKSAFSHPRSVSLSATGLLAAVSCLLYYEGLVRVLGVISFALLLVMGLAVGVGGMVILRYHTKSYKKATVTFLRSLNEQLQILRKQLMDLSISLNTDKSSSQQPARTSDISDILRSLTTVSNMIV